MTILNTNISQPKSYFILKQQLILCAVQCHCDFKEFNINIPVNGTKCSLKELNDMMGSHVHYFGQS